jgi:hypothetical protein
MRLRGFQSVCFAAAAVLASAVGCAGATKKDSKTGYVTVCEDGATTGSQIGRMRCHRKYDVDERARRDQAFMRHLQSESPRRKDTPPDQRIVSTVRHSGSAAGSYDQNQKQ